MSTNLLFADVRSLLGRKFEEIQETSIQRPFQIQNQNNDIKINLKDGIEITPKDVFKLYLNNLKAMAETLVKKPVRSAVITVPNSYGSHQRELVMGACREAGMKAVLINDTTAAAIAQYHNKPNTEPYNVMVIDFGAGNLDMSIIEVKNGELIVKASSGNASLGGADLDRNLVSDLAKHFLKDTGIDVKNNKRAVQRLFKAVEKAKRTLSEGPKAKIEIDDFVNGRELETIITRIR